MSDYDFPGWEKYKELLQNEWERDLRKDRDKVTEMLIKLYKQVTSFNVAHPTLRVHMPHEIYKWYKEEIKEKEND